jgi:hypothetical protein
VKNIKAIYLLTLSVLVSGCIFPVRNTRVLGSGEVITEPRRVSGFSSVELSGIGTLIIEQGSKESLEITAEDNILKYLKSSVYGRNLHLGVDDFVSIEPTKEIIYHLTVKNLERIEISGLGNVEIEALKTSDLDLKISGSGNAYIGNLQADSFNLQVSGLGTVEIEGSVEDQRIELSGAGSYDAEDLKSSKARIEISGTGKAAMWVENELDVELSGIGNLQYHGSPILNTEISGLGTVKISGLGTVKSLGDK